MIAALLLFCFRVLLWLVLCAWVALHLLLAAWFYVVERRERNPFGASDKNTWVEAEPPIAPSGHEFRPHGGSLISGPSGRSLGQSQKHQAARTFTFDSADHEQHIRRAIPVKLGVLK